MPDEIIMNDSEKLCIRRSNLIYSDGEIKVDLLKDILIKFCDNYCKIIVQSTTFISFLTEEKRRLLISFADKNEFSRIFFLQHLFQTFLPFHFLLPIIHQWQEILCLCY